MSGASKRPVSAPRHEEVTTLAELLRPERKAGRTVALANGCFDVIHVGHVRYLQGAADAADLLVVALNSDESVRALKGSGRPVLPLRDRMKVVAALEMVDHVLSFSETHVRRVLEVLRPDFHCKGTDYTKDSVPESDWSRELGVETLIVGDPKDHSTQDWIRKVSKLDSS